MGRFDQVSWNVFQACVDRQEGKRRVDMSEREYYGEWAVQQKVERMVRDARVLQQSVQYSIAAKNGLPRIGTYQIADPQGNDCQLIKQVLPGSRMK